MSVKLFTGNQYHEIKWWFFPDGARGVKIVQPEIAKKFRSFMVELRYESDQDFMDMLLLVDACREITPFVSFWLNVPYFPYSRQDRVMVDGESHSLRVAVNLIKMCNFDSIEVLDAHSDVLAGMFPAGVLKIRSQDECQYSLISNIISKWSNYRSVCLVAPDAGSLKKIYKSAKRHNLPVVEATKIRDVATGNIIRTDVEDRIELYQHAIICDDICGFGGTFVALSEAISKKNSAMTKSLITTHGIYGGDSKENLKLYFDDVLCVNDMEKK